MLSGTYARTDSSTPTLPLTPTAAGTVDQATALAPPLSRRAELALALAVVVLASGAVWEVGNWLLASWRLH